MTDTHVPTVETVEEQELPDEALLGTADEYLTAKSKYDPVILDELEAIKKVTVGHGDEVYDPKTEEPTSRSNRSGYEKALERRLKILQLVEEGRTVAECCDAVGIQPSTYREYRNRFPRWGAAVDTARMVHSGRLEEDAQSYLQAPALFIKKFFGYELTWFQLFYINELRKIPRGDILMALWPPEHGKTSTFELYANFTLAAMPVFRFLVASESKGIARKILGKVMDRMHPHGPSPLYVKSFGPFLPQHGGGITAVRQPWTDEMFRVYKARISDERNYSMEAVGGKGSIVSARTDHLHVDDIQSMKTYGQTEQIADWLRQDALSRPGESGRTSIAGTRVGEQDIYADLLDDDELGDMLKVLRLPAIITDPDSGEQKPLWERRPATPDNPNPPGHTMESLDRMRRKTGQERWDRNWMQDPGRNNRGKGTFTKLAVEHCKIPALSLTHIPGDNGRLHDPIIYIGLDPALGGKNAISAWEVRHNGRLRLVRMREDVGFQRNEQIMAALESVVTWCNQNGIVTDVVIEDKNFQKGLKNDERLLEMAKFHGFSIRGHTTGWNKYDEDQGVASMASTFVKGEIELPWADDQLTRVWVGEMVKQLYKWKPFVKGNKLRQDFVMTLWFVWMLWRSRRKEVINTTSQQSNGFSRNNGSDNWGPNRLGLWTPGGR
jgi:hypothetical protein